MSSSLSEDRQASVRGKMESSISLTKQLAIKLAELERTRKKIDGLSCLLAEGLGLGLELDKESILKLLTTSKSDLVSLEKDCQELQKSLHDESAGIASHDSSTAPEPKRQQLTLFAFCGKPGPKFATELKSASVCEGCQKDCINFGGLISHEKFCPKALILKQAKTSTLTKFFQERAQSGERVTSSLPSSEPPERPTEKEISYEINCEAPEEKRRGADTRKSYSVHFKLHVVRLVEERMRERKKGASNLVATEMNVASSLISRWYRDRKALEAACKSGGIKRGRKKIRISSGTHDDSDSMGKETNPEPAMLAALAVNGMQHRISSNPLDHSDESDDNDSPSADEMETGKETVQ